MKKIAVEIFSMGAGEFNFKFEDGTHAYWSGWKNGDSCVIMGQAELKKTITADTEIVEKWSGGDLIKDFRKTRNTLNSIIVS